MRETRTLVRPNILALNPYSTARDEYGGGSGVFLDANESPFDTGFNRYPDPHQRELKAKLSAIKGLPEGNIFIGNGSDEAIDLCFRVFCEPGRDNALILSPSYGMYGVCAAVNDVQVRELRLRGDFSLPSRDEILSLCDNRTKLLFLCSPNNPTGNAFDQDALMDIVSSFDGITVIDEAYADFSGKGSLRWKVLGTDNLIVLQTLSKAWGLAGLRLGLAFASEFIVGLFSEVKYPYNISGAAQKAVSEALERPIDGYVRDILAERGRLEAELLRHPSVERVYPSDANFLLVRTRDADALYSHLIADGIIVRNRSRLPLCGGCLRITVGLPEENDRLLKSITDYEKGHIH